MHEKHNRDKESDKFFEKLDERIVCFGYTQKNGQAHKELDRI